jgi:hypothetical protein
MVNYSKLNLELQKCLKIHNTNKHLVGRLNDKLLQSILKEIRQNPKLDYFVQFINCLNYFYSTRIQLAKGRKDDNVIRIAKIIFDNWKEGLNLSSINISEEVNTTKVEMLRKKIYDTVSVDLFSLTTKIFHQLNSQYPIYDSRVCSFLKKKALIGRINIKNDYDVFYSSYLAVVQKIGWPKNQINEFDTAIWVLSAP